MLSENDSRSIEDSFVYRILSFCITVVVCMLALIALGIFCHIFAEFFMLGWRLLDTAKELYYAKPIP